MIKVVQVCSDTNIGGAGKCLLTYLKTYDQNIFDVEVVLNENSALAKHIKNQPLHLIKNGDDKSIDLSAFFEYYKLFRRIRPDIVHTHGSLSARIAARFAGCKHIFFTRHSYFEQRTTLLTPLVALVNRMFADRVIAVAEICKQNLPGIPKNRVRVILNGVLPLEPMQDAMQYKRSLGIPENGRVVSITARLHKVKGHCFLLQAAESVLERMSDVYFVIAGEGEEKEPLIDLAKMIDIEKNVVFTGFIEDVTPLINITDIMVNASFGTEATSLSLLEGMSLGKPIVATSYGGNPGVVDNRNGILVPTKDCFALSQALCTLLEDPQLYESLSKGAREVFNQKFTAQLCTKAIEEYYLEEMGK